MIIHNKSVVENAEVWLNDAEIENYSDFIDGEYRIYITPDERLGEEFEISAREIKRLSDWYLEVIQETMRDYIDDLHQVREVTRIEGDKIRFGRYDKVDVDAINKAIGKEYCVHEIEYHDEDRGWMYTYQIKYRRYCCGK